jgi:RNA polymerase sigma factor (sigma-70 family)
MADAAFEADVLGALDRGDLDRALDRVMRELGAPVHRYCRQLIGDSALADDVLQMVFARVYERFDRFERRSSVRSWIFAIAHHRCLDAIKARRRWDRRFTSAEDTAEPASPEPPADERIGQGALGRAVAECLSRLEPHIRMAVVLRYQEGFPYDEIAEIARERPGTIQARVARAMPALRRCLEGKGLTP